MQNLCTHLCQIGHYYFHSKCKRSKRSTRTAQLKKKQCKFKLSRGPKSRKIQRSFVIKTSQPSARNKKRAAKESAQRRC